MFLSLTYPSEYQNDLHQEYSYLVPIEKGFGWKVSVLAVLIANPIITIDSMYLRSIADSCMC